MAFDLTDWFVVSTSIGLATIAWILIIIWNGLDGLSWANGDSKVFNWHPIFMGGFVVITLYLTLVWKLFAGTFKRSTTKIIHAILGPVALIFAILGLHTVFRFHNEFTPPIPNMYSIHSWLGMATVIYFVAQLVREEVNIYL